MKALALVFLSSVAMAQPLVARDTADVGKQGAVRVGVFAPLTYSATDWFELQVHPLLFFVDPHVTGRFGILRDGPLRLTAEVSLSVPTPVMRLTQGFLFPTWATSNNQIGWMLVPRGALLLSGGQPTKHVWTVLADFTFRVGFERTNAGPLTSFLAPLDLVMAAPLTGYVGRVGGAYDFALTQRLRIRGELNAYLTGTQQRLFVDGTGDVGPLPNLSPWYFTAHLGLDIGIGATGRLVLGGYWANYDSGATEVQKFGSGLSERVRVRSNNILPTIDFQWRW